MSDPFEMRVSGQSKAPQVAGAIAKSLRLGRVVELQAIGVPAVYLAVKAIIIARSYLEADGLEPAAMPFFSLLDVEGKERTAVKLRVESHARE